jgi:hypothetical protein
MKKTPFALILIGIAALLLTAAGRVSAQFETPNRSFHNATHFPLVGKHQTLTCEACHLNGQFRGTPKQCYDCHWIRRKDDRYQTRLGTQCDQCHQPTAWTAVRFDHASLSGVLLNADHRLLQCESCHRNANFRAGSAACVSCHQKDYNATRNPNHIGAGFGTACDSCHRPGDPTWQAGVNHNAFFPLVGVHATQPCAACHKNNVYVGTPRDCAGCHLPLYNATKNPNHIAASFPTTCDACHRATDATWTQAVFNHTRFPLTGPHNASCAQCHTNPSSFQVFSCITCHARSQTDSAHRGRPGYVYDSNACYSCHPNGRAG